MAKSMGKPMPKMGAKKPMAPKKPIMAMKAAMKKKGMK